MSDNLFEINVRFPIKLTGVVVVVVFGLTIGFYFVGASWEKTFIFFGVASAAGATVLAAFYTGRTLGLALNQAATFRARDQKLDELGGKERALRYGERWNHPQMHYARDVCRQVYEHRGRSAQEISDFAERNKTNLTNMLNFFEEMAFALEFDMVDNEIVREQFCGVVTTVYQILEPWINQERVNRGRPNIWVTVEGLKDAWR